MPPLLLPAPTHPLQSGLIKDAAMRNYGRWASVYDNSYFKTHLEQWNYEVGRLIELSKQDPRAMDGRASDGWVGGRGVALPSVQAVLLVAQLP